MDFLSVASFIGRNMEIVQDAHMTLVHTKYSELWFNRLRVGMVEKQILRRCSRCLQMQKRLK